MDSIGRYLKRTREARAMSVEEVSRATRIPVVSIERIEGDHFDDLPGEVFVRGFLKAYARAVALPVDDVLARYTASRRIAWVTPLPTATPVRRSPGRRFGVVIAFVLLLILFTLALSIVLRPRGHDMPPELSSVGSSRTHETTVASAARLGRAREEYRQYFEWVRPTTRGAQQVVSGVRWGGLG